MTLATEFYDAKARIAAAMDERPGRISFGYGHGALDEFLIDILGYEPPTALLDERGKPIKVWQTTLNGFITEDARKRFRWRRPEGSRQSYNVIGYTVAKSSAEIKRHYEAVAGFKARDAGGTEIPVTDLAYPLTAANPGMLVRQDQDTREYLIVAPEDIAIPREPRP